MSEAAFGGAPESFRLLLPGGGAVPVLRYTPPAPQATLVFSPALGVHAGFYDRLARALAGRGLDVLLHEQRGHGTSPIRASRHDDWGYRELVEEEVATIAAHARATAGGRPLLLGGHSLGGQLACLAAATMARPPDGLAIVASALQHGRLYPPGWQLRIAIASRLFPPVARLRGFHDGARMGFGGREARRLITDWAHVARTGRYEPQGTEFPYEARLAQLAVPLLLVTFTRDTFAPERAALALAAKMRGCPLTHRRLDAAVLRGALPDHFDWARKPEAVSDLLARFANRLEMPQAVRAA